LRQAFANLLFAQEKVAVAERIMNLRMDNSKMVSLKYESGRESKGNMLRSKAEFRQAQADMASATRNVRAAQKELNRQLGLDVFDSAVATGTLQTAPLMDLPDTRPLVDNHPQVRVLTFAREVSKAELASARSSLWPYLSANYSRTRIGEDFFPDTAHWNASANLSYRLFGSGLSSTYYESVSAKRRLEKAEEDLRSTRNQIGSGLESAWAALATNIEQVQVKRDFLEAASQRNKESTIRYSSGLMSYEDWELAVGDLVNYESGVIEAERDAVLAEAQWAEALGKTLEEK
jgi:outer membrane protein TolC